MSKALSKIRQSAKGEECLVRIPGVCNFRPDTTIPAHLNGGGMACKKNDIQSAYCCSDCHDVIDGRVKSSFSHDELELMHRQGVERTQNKLIDKGLIVIK